MDQKIIGFGVSIITLCICWIFPTIPKPIAWAGLSIGVAIVLLSFFPSIKTGPFTLGLAGICLLATAIAWQYISPSEPVSPASSSAPFSALSQEKAKVAGIDLNRYSKKACFDYSTNNGRISISLNSINFELHFDKASDTQIHLYNDGTNILSIARLKNISPGEDINFEAFDSTSRVYTIGLGGYFIAKNTQSYLILGRVLSIKDNKRGDAEDEVCFAYSIDTSKTGKFKAI